jgi:predicted porin
MKMRVLTGAVVLATCAGGAWADGVTVYGLVDQAVGKQAGSPTKQVLDSSGSRLGFRGEEDLGDGLKATFLLEHRFSPDTGSAATPFWKGGAWVGLEGGFGKVTVGRWWTQSFLKSEFASDPFGMETVGLSFGTVGCGAGCVGSFWIDNSVTYEYAAGPVSFGVQVAAAEGTMAHSPYNGGISYASGPLYLAFGYENPGNDNDAWSHATANYDFGPVKLISGFGAGKNVLAQSVRNLVVGFNAPLGTGMVIGSYNQHEVDGTTVSAKPSLGYQYFFSKRTKLFTTVTYDSKAASDKSGFDLGLIHHF